MSFSVALLVQLPDLLLVSLLSQWMDIVSIYTVDMALTNQRYRPRWLSTLMGVKEVDISPLNMFTFHHNLTYYGIDSYTSTYNSTLVLNWLRERQFQHEMNIYLCLNDAAVSAMIRKWDEANIEFLFVARLLLLFRDDRRGNNELLSYLPDLVRQIMRVFPRSVVSFDIHDPGDQCCQTLLQDMQSTMLSSRVEKLFVPNTLVYVAQDDTSFVQVEGYLLRSIKDGADITESSIVRTFLQVLGSKIVDLGTPFECLNRNLLEVLYQFCPRLECFPFYVTPGDISSDCWLLIQSFRALTSLDFSLEDSKTNGDLLGGISATAAYAEPLLYFPNLQTVRLLAASVQASRPIMAGLLKHCRHIRWLQAAPWFSFSTSNPYDADLPSFNDESRTHYPTLELTFYPYMFRDNEMDSTQLTLLLYELADTLPPIRQLIIGRKEDQSDALSEQHGEYSACLEAIYGWLQTAPCCKKVVEVKFDQDTVFPIVTLERYCLPGVQYVTIDNDILLQDPDQDMDEYPLVATRFVECFPNVTSLSVSFHYSISKGFQTLEAILEKLPALQSLHVSGKDVLICEKLLCSLIRCSRLWNFVMVTFDTISSNSAAESKVNLHMDLFKGAIREEQLKVQKLVLRGRVCDNDDQEFICRELGYGKLPIRFIS